MQVDSSNSRRGFLVNTFFSLISWLFPLCLAFIATPIIVKALGNELYGIYALFLGFLSFAFTTGVGRVAAKYIPEYTVSGDRLVLAETLSATLWLSISIGIVQAVILASATAFLVTDILLIGPGMRDIATTSLYLASGAGLVMMVSQVFQSALHGQHRFDSYALLTNLNGLLLASGNIFLVWNGFGVETLAVWNLVLTATFALLFYFSARRHLPELRLLLHFPRDIFRSVARYAGSIVIYQGLTSLLYAFERSWIVRTSGTEALTFYVIPMMLAIYMHGLLVNILYVLFPAANELLNDRERLIALYKRATRAALVLLAFILTTYICTGRAFLLLWVGEEFAARSYDLLVIHGVTYGLNAICIVAWMLAETFRAPSLNVLSTSLWVAAAIPLMVIAGGNWNIEGIALARLAGVVLTVPLIFYIEKKFFGHMFLGFWGGILWKAALSSIALAAVQVSILSYTGAGWGGLMIAATAGAVVFGGGLYFTGYLSRDEISTAREAIKGKVFGLR